VDRADAGTSVRELERVTRAVLAGRGNESIDPTGGHDAHALAVAGHTTGMAPVLGRLIEDGCLTAAPDVVRRFTEYLDHARRRTARIEREVAPAIDALVAANVSPVILKGFHTSRAYFDEPALRRMADVDVLVSPDALDDAESALRSGGFEPASNAPTANKRDWIAVDIDRRVFSLELPDERTRWMLELHTSLDRIFHPGAVAKFDAERTCVEPQMIAGRRLLVLRQPLLLLTLACHCSQELDGSRLLRLFEMTRVIRADTAKGRLDWDELLEMVRRTGVAHFTYPALTLVEHLAPATVDARLLALGRRRSTWAARHTVARLVPAGGSLDDRGVLRQAMWTRGPVAVLQRLLRLFWPAPFTSTDGVGAAWRARLRRIRSGVLSLRAPDERGGSLR
ncbi:MAG: nucleotidyltransferase family protein, partial [bacterium]